MSQLQLKLPDMSNFMSNFNLSLPTLPKFDFSSITDKIKSYGIELNNTVYMTIGIIILLVLLK